MPLGTYVFVVGAPRRETHICTRFPYPGRMEPAVVPTFSHHRGTGSSAVTVVGVGVLGGLAAVATIIGGWHSAVVQDPELTAALKGVTVASYVAVGAYTLWRRPRSRLGPLVATAGFVYTAAALTASSQSLPFAVGRLTTAALVTYFVYLFLCFPRDRLSSAFERRFVRLFAVATTGVWIVVLLLADKLPRGGALSDCMQRCPDNPFQAVDGSHAVTQAVNLTANGVTALGLVALMVLLMRRAGSPAHLRRRAIVPLLYAATVFSASFAIYSLLSQANAGPNVHAFRILTAAGAIAVPTALLVGQFRGRIFAATNLWRLLETAPGHGLTPVWVEGLLGSSLGDPSFALALWAPERNGYVDALGAPFELPAPSVARSVTRIDREGTPAIALLHDPLLEDEPEVVEGLGATALMLLENARLVEGLQASRARMAESAERERLRLERNLHDGAQQRLMAIRIKLALAREQVGDGELGAQLDELDSDAAAAVEELRELAHGIYPTVLRERGLAEALKAFAHAVPNPIQIEDRGVGRAASGVEVAVYYCSLEAIQNAVKHSGADSSIAVTVSRSGDRIEFEVSDAGAGFQADRHADGMGLVSMRDRIAAVGGELKVDSSPGRGTVVSGSVPVALEPVAHSPERELGS
jgi:signal transduction histidine kinase